MKHSVLPEHDITALIGCLNFFHPISCDIGRFLQKQSFPCFVRKKKLLLKAGALCPNIYFIKRGAVRGFVKEANRDITTWIMVENEMVTSISALATQGPSEDNMQAIEDCELIGLSFNDLENLYGLFPEFNIVIRKILLRYYHDAERRAFVARLAKAENKYYYFLATQGHLANRIPLKYIASYLGIAEETLSRVRKRTCYNRNR